MAMRCSLRRSGALAAKPELVEAWYGRGNALAALRQGDGAFAAYDKALALQPDCAEAWLGRANAFFGAAAIRRGPFEL